jgi:ribosome recycling factor
MNPALVKVHKECTERMHKAVEAMEHEFSTLRTGRASLAILDVVSVEVYGQKMHLNQVATLSTPDAHTILIQPWDRGVMGTIEKAILAANIGLTPSNDGRVIRLSIPPLTEERRKDLVKVAQKMAEEGRVAIRNIRRHFNEDIKRLEKEKTISEDDAHEGLNDIQKLTDKHIEDIGTRLKRKEAEILEI